MLVLQGQLTFTVFTVLARKQILSSYVLWSLFCVSQVEINSYLSNLTCVRTLNTSSLKHFSNSGLH
jgi:hypothetical protein